MTDREAWCLAEALVVTDQLAMQLWSVGAVYEDFTFIWKHFHTLNRHILCEWYKTAVALKVSPAALPAYSLDGIRKALPVNLYTDVAKQHQHYLECGSGAKYPYMCITRLKGAMQGQYQLKFWWHEGNEEWVAGYLAKKNGHPAQHEGTRLEGSGERIVDAAARLLIRLHTLGILPSKLATADEEAKAPTT